MREKSKKVLETGAFLLGVVGVLTLSLGFVQVSAHLIYKGLKSFRTGPTNVQKLPNLPKFGDFKPEIPRLYLPIVVYGDKDRSFCSGAVIDAHYILTAAHCVVDQDHMMSTADLVVYDTNKASKGFPAKVAAVNIMQDYALLIGDFTAFAPAKVDFYGSAKLLRETHVEGITVSTGANIVSCGFPYGQIPHICNVVTDIKPYYFMYVGGGMLIPGMSGGPAFAKYGEEAIIVGVNSAVSGELAIAYGTNVLIAPVLGLLGAFGLQGGGQ